MQASAQFQNLLSVLHRTDSWQPFDEEATECSYLRDVLATNGALDAAIERRRQKCSQIREHSNIT